MPVSASDIKSFKSANMPNDETSTQGGAITSTQITGTTVGEVIAPPITSSNPTGGLDRVHRKKYFIQNTNVSDNFYSVQYYIANLLLDITTTGVVTFVSTNSGDTMNILLTGIDHTGAPFQETLGLTGTTPVSSVTSIAHLQTVETAGDAAVAGNVTVTDHGSLLLGMIPATKWSATTEVEVGLAPSKNDTATVGNSLTNPSSVVFSKPNTLGTSLTLPGDGNLDSGDGIGIWIRLTTKAGLQTRTRIQFCQILTGTV